MRALSLFLGVCAALLLGFWGYRTLDSSAPSTPDLPSVHIENFSIPLGQLNQLNQPQSAPQAPVDPEGSWKTHGQGMTEDGSTHDSDRDQDTSVNWEALASSMNEDTLACLVMGPIKEERLPEFRTKMQGLGIFEKAFIEKVLTDDQFWVYVGPYDTQEKAQEVEQKALQSFSDIKVGPLETGGWAVYLRTFKDEFEARSWLQQASVILGGPRLSIYRPKTEDHHLVNLVFDKIHQKDLAPIRSLSETMKEKVFPCATL